MKTKLAIRTSAKCGAAGALGRSALSVAVEETANEPAPAPELAAINHAKHRAILVIISKGISEVCRN